MRVTYIHFLKLASTINFLFPINVPFLKVEIKWFTLLLLFSDFNIYTKNNYDFTAVDHIHIQQSLDMGNADISLDYCSIEQLGFTRESL